MASDGGQTAALTLDGHAYFQMMQHGLLLKKAAQENFPMPLARLAVHIARRPRRLAFAGQVTDKLVSPSRGVLPGCLLADPLTKLYVLETMDEIVTQHDTMDFDLYVDDLVLSAWDAQGRMTRISIHFAQAAMDVDVTLTDELGITMVNKSGAVVASNTQ